MVRSNFLFFFAAAALLLEEKRLFIFCKYFDLLYNCSKLKRPSKLNCPWLFTELPKSISSEIWAPLSQVYVALYLALNDK